MNRSTSPWRGIARAACRRVLAAAAVAAASAAQAAGNHAAVLGYGLNLGQAYGYTHSTPSFAFVAGIDIPFWVHPGYGEAGPWGGPEVPYPIEFLGAARADGMAGRLQAMVHARYDPADPWADGAPSRNGLAVAQFDGRIVLSSEDDGEDRVSTRIGVRFDGDWTFAAGYMVQIHVESLSDPGRSWSEWVTGPFDGAAGSIDGTFWLDVDGSDGEVFRVFQRLEVEAWSTGTGGGSFNTANFYNTAAISFAPAAGTRVYGVDGFLSQVQGVSVVPEPAGLVLMALGVAALLAARRRGR